MQPEEIKWDDLWRIFVGQVPAGFLLEAVLRAIFLFALLMLGMRLLGKRMAGQLSKNEMIGMTSLAAAIGVPIQAPDRGLLPALIIATIVVLTGRLISRWAFRSQRFESLSQDRLAMLVEDSVLQLDALKRTTITRERLFSHLRSKGITHLGQLKRVYFEAGGFFTLVRRPDPQPGLNILPVWDTDILAEQKTDTGRDVCSHCGSLRRSTPCGHCGGTTWEAATAGLD